jgi:gas vesicle protein
MATASRIGALYDPTIMLAAEQVRARRAPTTAQTTEIKAKWHWDDASCAAAIYLVAQSVVYPDPVPLGSSDKISNLINGFIAQPQSARELLQLGPSPLNITRNYLDYLEDDTHQAAMRAICHDEDTCWDNIKDRLNEKVSELANANQPNSEHVEAWIKSLSPLAMDAAPDAGILPADLKNSISKAGEVKAQIEAHIPKIKWKLIKWVVIAIAVAAIICSLFPKFMAITIAVTIVICCCYIYRKKKEKSIALDVYKPSLDKLDLSFYTGAHDKPGIFRELWDAGRQDPKLATIKMYGYAHELKNRLKQTISCISSTPLAT